MNIWIINETIGSKIHGMVYRPYYMAKEFVKKGMTVTIFTGSYTHILSNPPEFDGRYKKEIIDGVNYCWVKTPKYSRSQSLGRIINAFSFVFKLFTVNKKEFGKPDVIIVTSPTPFSIINGYFYKLKYKAKLIFEVRDIWPLTLIEIGRISKRHPFVLFTQIFENFCYKVSDIVVSVLPKAKEHMVEHWMDESKFRYIPNGIDLEEAESLQELPDQVKSQIPADKFIVMYAGKIGISNALGILVETAIKMKEREEVLFLIVGSGPEKDALFRMIEDSGCGNIKIMEPVPKDMVQLLLSLADCCYIGLEDQSVFKMGVSANKMFDYMYSGKPVICGINAPGNPIEESGCGIIVKSGSSERIIYAVEKLYNMTPEERKNMGEMGRKYVISHHAYEKLAEKYAEIFNGD